MAKNRGSERGVVQVACSFLLAGIGALLSVTGCSAEQGDVADGESLGTVTQAVAQVCGTTTCQDLGPCVKVDCSLVIKNTCIYTDAPGDASVACKTAFGAGVCVQATEELHPSCCTGCYRRLKTGGYGCVDKPTALSCGAEGSACTNCDLGDQCMDYSCSAGQCDRPVPRPELSACRNGTGFCVGGKCCGGCLDKAGACQPGTDVKLCGNSAVLMGKVVDCNSCVDGSVCTNDVCKPDGACANPAVPDGTGCLDANKCDGGESCQGGVCKEQVGFMCQADTNACTVTVCDPITGCANVPVEAGTSCDNDANKCNGTAKCEGTVCKPSAAVDCDDGNICTTDSCNPTTGACVYTNNTVDCSDNDLCTLVDKCSAGKCVGTGAPQCNDNEFCTTDSCDKLKGCVNAPLAENTSCDDGNSCSTGDKCIAGKCSFVMGKDCNDKNACTIDACAANACTPKDEVNGTPCVFDKCHVNSECQSGACTQGDPINCDDGNPCTTDSCVGATGCKHVNVDGGDCSDNNACTTTDKCAAGKCVGAAVVCAAIDDCHLAGTCDAKTGTCTDPRAPDDTECKNGAGACKLGTCQTTPGAGGAGGEGPDGQAGQATGGSAIAQGGEPATGAGGEGATPTNGGDTGGPNGGTAGKASGGTATSNEGGSPDDPSRVFVRDPGGCSCSLPGSEQSGNLAWLGGLALAAVIVGRRRGGRGPGRQDGGPLFP